MQFTKEGDKVIEEMKLRVVYKNLTGRANSEASGMASPRVGSDDVSVRFFFLFIIRLYV